MVHCKVHWQTGACVVGGELEERQGARPRGVLGTTMDAAELRALARACVQGWDTRGTQGGHKLRTSRAGAGRVGARCQVADRQLKSGPKAAQGSLDWSRGTGHGQGQGWNKAISKLYWNTVGTRQEVSLAASGRKESNGMLGR